MLTLLALAALGLALLTVAADHLVLGAGRLAARFGISPVVVGVVVIGLGTSAPELVVSGIASVRGDGGLAVANLVGSNVLNVTVILGIAALVAPVKVRPSVPPCRSWSPRCRRNAGATPTSWSATCWAATCSTR